VNFGSLRGVIRGFRHQGSNDDATGTRNPWHPCLLDGIRNSMRFLLWASLAVNGGIVAIYSILLTGKLCSFLWSYLLRTLFAEAW
jgi:hypothetical protein